MILEQIMKHIAADLTGKDTNEIPDTLEDICLLIHEHEKEKETSYQQVASLEKLTEAPTQEDFNALIDKLKEAKIFV